MRVIVAVVACAVVAGGAAATLGPGGRTHAREDARTLEGGRVGAGARADARAEDDAQSVPAAATTMASATTSAPGNRRVTVARRDVAFVRNDGQWEPGVRFGAARGGVHVFLCDGGAEFRLTGRGATGRDGTGRDGTGCDGAGCDGAGQAAVDALVMRWEGLGEARVVEGARAAGVRHFLRGSDAAAWRRDVPAFTEVRYEGRGAAIEFHGRNGPIEYDVVVPPGGDPSALRLRFEGAESVTIDGASGELVVRTRLGEMRHSAPVVFQDTADGRRAVAAHYVAAGPAAVTFAIDGAAAVDTTLPLRIDPAVRWSTYIGSTDDEAFGCAGLPGGASIVVGKTASFDHIVTPDAFQPAKRPAPPAAGHDCFVTKFNAAGDVVWSTYFGGTLTAVEEAAFGVTVDDLGRPWFCGQTGSPDLPLRNAFRSTFGGAAEAFVAALTSDGSDVYVSTFLGGGASEAAYSVSRSPVDGTFAVAGGTSSADFPTVGAADGSFAGGQDGFVARVSADGRTLLSSTYVGGSGTDELRRVAHDAAGHVLLAGFTTSSGIATAGAAQGARGGSTDGLLAKMPPDASRFTFLTYVAGSGDELLTGLAATAAGDLAFCGQTTSPNLPVTLNAADPDIAGQDAVVGILTSDGTAYRYLTFAGGSGADSFSDLAILPDNSIALCGRTRSSDFPLVSVDATKATYTASGGAGDTDGVIVQLDETGRALVFGTFFGGDTGGVGGEAGDRLHGVAVDGNGGIVVCGTSAATDFPQVSPARESIAASPVGVSVAARLGSDPAGTIAIKRAEIFNSLSADGDRIFIKGKATLAGGTDVRLSARRDRLSFSFGPGDAARFSVVVPPRTKGYTTPSGGRVAKFVSRNGAKPVVRITFNVRTGQFRLTASKFSFPAIPTTDLAFTMIAGEEGFSDRRTWVDAGGGGFRVAE